jgi:hypothetical protein
MQRHDRDWRWPYHACMDIFDTETIVSVTVVRAVDERGQLTDDPTRVVEGELMLITTDGSRRIVSIYRSPERRPAIVGA